LAPNLQLDLEERLALPHAGAVDRASMIARHVDEL
jgi:hypothetical protein